MMKISKLAFPSMIALFFSYFAEVINTFYVGHLNNSEMLAGAGMGNVIIYMMCTCVYLGMNGTLETFIS